MPKQKTHSSTKKRFWLTGSGKVNRSHSGKNHKAEPKPAKEEDICVKLLLFLLLRKIPLKV